MPDGDQGRWLSYVELGELLGCTANAARMHAVRRKWPRRASNRIGGAAHVLVPEGAVVRSSATHADAPCDVLVRPNGRAASGAQSGTLQAIRALESAVEGLREQFTREHDRAERAEQEIVTLRT